MTGASESAREQIIRQLRRTIDHVKAGTIPQTDRTMSIPTTHYTDPERWQREVDLVFKRRPLMLALTCEMAEPGDYKAMDVCGVKFILSRGQDGNEDKQASQHIGIGRSRDSTEGKIRVILNVAQNACAGWIPDAA